MPNYHPKGYDHSRRRPGHPQYKGVWIHRRAQLEQWCREEIPVSHMAKRFGTSSRHVRAAIDVFGIPYTCKPFAGKNNGSWKGGRIDAKGYVKVYAPEHPRKDRHNKVWEHWLVMEKKLGRPMAPGEVVHHLNGDRSDNRPENLELFASNGDHLRATLAGKCPNWTDEGIRRMVHGFYHGPLARMRAANPSLSKTSGPHELEEIVQKVKQFAGVGHDPSKKEPRSTRRRAQSAPTPPAPHDTTP